MQQLASTRCYRGCRAMAQGAGAAQPPLQRVALLAPLLRRPASQPAAAPANRPNTPKQQQTRPRRATRCAAVSLQDADAAAAAVQQLTATPLSFEPHVDPSIIYGQLAVLALTLGAAAYWWWSVVPSARRTLAKEKRSGPLREYLEDIQSNESKGLERWFYTDWLKKLERQQEMARRGAARRAAAAAAEGAGALSAETGALGATDPQQQQQQQQQGQQQQQQQASQQYEDEYVDRQPAFLSLDNPLIATAVLILGFGALNAVVHALTTAGS